jgi:hypothetical protein
VGSGRFPFGDTLAAALGGGHIPAHRDAAAVPHSFRVTHLTKTSVLGSIGLIFVGAALAWAQGPTGGTIYGVVAGAAGADVEGAHVTISHGPSGVAFQRTVRNGRFFASGLQVGGPYTVVVSRVGLNRQQMDSIFLRLGEPLRLSVSMYPAAIPLEEIVVRADLAASLNHHGGTATLVADSLLHRLPTLDRNLYDFARLAPQISTRVGIAGGGISGGGAGFRYNAFTIDGVPQRSIGGHVPPEFAGARSIPFDAVAEYQLLVAPFDVRYGDFTGALVEAVTRSGTNRFSGSAFASGRNDELSRRAAGDLPYERLQYGFTMGGPIVRDRVHFFAAADLQHFTSLAAGPYIGQPESRETAVPVSAEDIARLEEALNQHGLVGGSAGAVRESNPIHSLFARVDVAAPAISTRARISLAESRSRALRFSRAPAESFPLSSNSATQHTVARQAAIHLHTDLPGGVGRQNELFVAFRESRLKTRSPSQQPVVRVLLPRTTGGVVRVVAGTPPQSHGVEVGGWAVNLRNETTLPIGGSHVAVLGVEAERFESERSGVQNSFGSWDFASIDSLKLGLADRFELRRDFGSAGVPMGGLHVTAYAGDHWQFSERLTVTGGVRAEVLSLRGRPPYNARVDSIFGRRTDLVPRERVHLSPRVGFTLRLPGEGEDRLRGGVGVFTARPPAAWLHSAYQNYGLGVGLLRCGRLAGDMGPPPAFVPDHVNPPTECANQVGPGSAPAGDIELLDPALKLAQSLRGVLAYERSLGRNLVGTLEGLVSRTLSDFAFVNLNLVGPVGADRRGRVLYGTIGPFGTAEPARRNGFGQDVVELTNVSSGYAFQLATKVERRFSEGSAASAHYTFSRVRDVQTPLRIYVPAVTNWASRAVSGRHDDQSAGISLNAIPHRVVVAGTRSASWGRGSVAFSVYYVGESGSPFTYIVSAPVRARGDLNADGSNVNDPVYVPVSALEPGEILFAPLVRQTPLAGGGFRRDTVDAAEQAAAFERFVSATACLRSQRGTIARRNSCREPWSNFTVASVRGAMPLQRRTLEAQVDVYNLLNLVNRSWGHRRVVDPVLLEHAGQSSLAADADPTFNFDERRTVAAAVPSESAFQLQLSLRYRF